MTSSTLSLLLFLALVIAGAKLSGLASTRFGQPAVLGELLLGLVLGPSVVDILNVRPFDSHELQVTIESLAELGVILLMFLAGLEVQLDELRHAGRVSLLAGTLGVVAPLILGAVAALPFGYNLSQAIFIGIILTATSVSISAQTLMELGVLRSREGVALLGAAVIDDVISIMVLSLYMAVALGGGAGSLFGTVVRIVVYLAIAGAAARWIVPRLTAWVQGLPVSQGTMAVAITTTLVFAWSAEVLGGMAAITGAFVAGLAFARTPWRHGITEGTHTIVYSLLVPVFFVSIGLRADARGLDAAGLILLAVIVATAIVSKILGCGLGALLAGFPRSSALRLGVGMISRGEVGLIVCTVGLGAGLIDEAIFSDMVIMVLATTLVTPLLLRRVFPRAAVGVARAPATPAKGGE